MAEEGKAKKTQKKWEKYELEGETLKRKRTCPKCGPGVFLAEHGDRYSCGACGYMEKKSSASEQKPPEKKPEPKEEKPPEKPKGEAPKEEAPSEEKAEEAKPQE